ncbi:hypothetical protein Pint_01317 [Pistacia integerrima]|uniref:Uncharacterized protein n=1 Tax=Pistacia integerrima TaxID=434235 RepID=A0ACC0ZIE3_9ROSI|nr:hypothetical protein Pint_01317 [Pistacia integerrima]
MDSISRPLQCSTFAGPRFENGPMLLRVNSEPLPYGLIKHRLAGSEEVLPDPDVNQFIDSSVPKEIEISIQTCLFKPLIAGKDCKSYWTSVQIESRDYNPVLNERGFHQKLNSLVKESLQFGSVPPKLHETTLELNATQSDSSEVTAKLNSAIDVVVLREDPMVDLTTGEDKTASSITEEWEQLVVSAIPEKYSPTCITKSKLDQSVLSPPDINRQLDEKTSRILERLEVPRKLKTKVVSPISTSSSISDTFVTMKKPLIPFQPSQSTDQDMSSSQLMKPNFQRLKRKHK